MNKVYRCFASALCSVAAFTITAAEVKLVPLPLQLPVPSFSVNGIYELPKGPHIEPIPNRPRPVFYAPTGVTNVARGKNVSCNSGRILSGRLRHITDGLKEEGEQLVTLDKGARYVQIDLLRETHLYAILVWHDLADMKFFHDVIVQVSSDHLFETNVITLFNNDWDNSSRLGFGADMEYYDSHEGKLIDAKGVKALFVRLYSNGYWNAKANASFRENEYREVEVYGIPVKVYDAAGQEVELAPLPLSLPSPGLK